jgi:ADP-heptose:LPS heptosyltransferase
VHIARALETPVIGLYGHTDPRLHGPYRAYEDLTIDRFNHDAPGVPAAPEGGRSKSGRMPMISVEDVLEKVEYALENYVRPVGPASGRG